MSNVHLLLLAAGGSRRMKEPKQLLPWGTTTLIAHQIQNLLDTKKSLSVVLGAYAERILPVIDSLPINIVHNELWENGMGTSIAKGAQHVLEQNSLFDGILISLIDQPFVTTAHFNKMLKLFKPGEKQIIVSQADDRWSGAPVLFDKFYIEDLMSLVGDQGAKKVMNAYRDLVKPIDGGDLLVDIDTPEAYQRLLSQFIKSNS